MKEEFMYFIWQSGGLFTLDLRTTEGKKISVLKPGYRNRGEGPDFFDAKIKIGKVTWYGPVEFHIKTSDWDLHGHQNDPAYNNVILHIVMQHDRQIKTGKGVCLPTLCLQKYIDANQLNKYRALRNSKSWIPCEGLFVRDQCDIFWPQFLARLSVERLGEKSARILQEVEKSDGNWDAVVFQQTGRYLAGKKNAGTMAELLNRVPYKLISRYHHSSTSLLALLYGQAGMLEGEVDDSYFRQLKNEYHLLRLKHQLQPLPAGQWSFMPVRPPSFPTLRISQLALMMASNPRPLRMFIGIESSRELKDYFMVQAPDYWDSHYLFGKRAQKTERKRVGPSMADLLLINVAAPILFAYGLYTGSEDLREKAVTLLEETKSENNSILKNWKRLGIGPENAMESQGLLQLKTQYCEKGRCLECSLGSKLLQETVVEYRG